MSVNREEFRLLDETGLSVAEVCGPGALNEILHYVLVYQQDGPHRIQSKLDGKWHDWEITFTKASQ